MSSFPVYPKTTSKCHLGPVSRHLAGCGDNLPNCTARSTNVAASDWRAEAEAAGRAASEAILAEPQTIAEPLAWLWGKPARTGRYNGAAECLETVELKPNA